MLCSDWHVLALCEVDWCCLVVGKVDRRAFIIGEVDEFFGTAAHPTFLSRLVDADDDLVVHGGSDCLPSSHDSVRLSTLWPQPAYCVCEKIHILFDFVRSCW